MCSAILVANSGTSRWKLVLESSCAKGREADIVILSLVRAREEGEDGNIGFLQDIRRMNVALTRPRRSLWVIGRAKTLRSSTAWRSFVDHAKETGSIVTATPPFDEIFGSNKSKIHPKLSCQNSLSAKTPSIVSMSLVSIFGGVTGAYSCILHFSFELRLLVSQTQAQNTHSWGAPDKNREISSSLCTEGKSKVKDAPLDPRISQNEIKNIDVNHQHPQGTTNINLPADMHKPKAVGAAKTRWKEKMGIVPKAKVSDVLLPDHTSFLKKPPTKKQEVGSVADKKGSSAEDKASSRKATFDIQDLLGDVVKSNSRSKFYTGNAPKRFNS